MSAPHVAGRCLFLSTPWMLTQRVIESLDLHLSMMLFSVHDIFDMCVKNIVHFHTLVRHWSSGFSSSLAHHLGRLFLIEERKNRCLRLS